MKATEENIAVRTVTITPEEQQAIEQTLIDLTVAIGLLRTMRDSGKLSNISYRRCTSIIGAQLEFKKDSILTDFA